MNKQQHITAIIKDRKGNILSIGKNSYVKTHTVQAHYAELVGEPKKIYLHAEIHAITKCRDLDKAHSIEVFRYYKDGTPANAKPCNICMAAIKESNIKLIRWTE